MTQVEFGLEEFTVHLGLIRLENSRVYRPFRSHKARGISLYKLRQMDISGLQQKKLTKIIYCIKKSSILLKELNLLFFEGRIKST